MNNIPKPALTVGLMGLFPFVAISGLQVITIDENKPLYLLLNNQQLDNILILYGIIILSFISGSFWTMAIKSEFPLNKSVYVISILPSLIMFVFLACHVLLVINNLAYSFFIMISRFIGILMFDLYFSNLNLTPSWWLKLRFILTPIVLIALFVGLIN